MNFRKIIKRLNISLICKKYLITSTAFLLVISCTVFSASSLSNNILNENIINNSNQKITAPENVISGSTDDTSSDNSIMQYAESILPEEQSIYSIKSINHKGYNSIAPENTLLAYRLSKEKGYSYVETDIQWTSDGVAVLLHDDSINRTARNADGTAIKVDEGKTVGSYTISSADIGVSINVKPVSDDIGKTIGNHKIISSEVGNTISVTPTNTINIKEITYAQALTYDFGSWKSSTYKGTKITSFEDLIALCKDLNLQPYLDLKDYPTEAKAKNLAAILKKYDMTNSVTFVTFSSDYVASILAQIPTARIGYMIPIDDRTIARVNAIKTASNTLFVYCNYLTDVNENYLQSVLNAGIKVELFVMDNASLVPGWVNKGISGFTTNNLNIPEILFKHISNITLNYSSKNLYIGDKFTLVDSIEPYDATNKNVTWATSNNNVATVDETGTVTATGAGSANITVTTADGSKTTVCKVTVEIPVTGVTLNKSTTTLIGIGTAEQLSATIAPADATNKNVTWDSSNKNVATVDGNGMVTANGAGSADITVTTADGGKTAVCTVTVEIAAAGVTLNKSATTLIGIGTVEQLSATIAPADATNKNVTWDSSNKNVATVDGNGMVTANGAGSADITATTADGSKTAICKVTVKIAVTGIKLNNSTTKLTVIGTTEQLLATIEPTDATNKNVTWDSSNKNVATVNGNGTVTATGSGSADITVTTVDGSKTAVCKVTVELVVTGVTLNKSELILTGIGAAEHLSTTIAPADAKNKNVTWVSNNKNVATVDEIGTVTTVGYGTATISAITTDGEFSANCKVVAQIPAVSVSYRTHVQNVGWQSFVSNGDLSGTTGQSLRLEGIKISVSNNNRLGISYSTHVQDVGWQGFVSNGTMSGTEGRSLRLEAIKIKLTGLDAELYDVYYRVHAENYGWLSWAKNGEAAGTEGLGLRLEAIEIEVVKKTDKASFDTNNPFVSAYGGGLINYRTHVENVGWQNYASDGNISGTTGQSLRLEGINIRLSTNLPSGSVVYSTHVQDIGWMNEVSDGALSGTQGQSKRLEAIKISLSGEIENQYDIYYRVHAQNIGWMGWAKNGERAGTAGFSYRLEGIQIVLVPKGQAAPGSTANSFVQR